MKADVIILVLFFAASTSSTLASTLILLAGMLKVFAFSLAPLLWAISWLTARCAIRLPKMSWKRLWVALLSLGGLGAIVRLQAYLLLDLQPVGAGTRDFDLAMGADIVPTLALFLFTLIREDRAQKKAGGIVRGSR